MSRPRSPSLLLAVLGLFCACTQAGDAPRSSAGETPAPVAAPADAGEHASATASTALRPAPPNTPPVESPPDEAPLEPPTPSTAIAPPDPEPPEPPDADGPVSDAEAIEAYIKDCGHRFTVAADEGYDDDDDEQVAECEFVEFDQNCASDPAGCWGDGQQCIAACGPPCSACQTSCASECTSCKERCEGGAADCVRECAAARQACRARCLDARTKCRAVDCAKQERDCERAFTRDRKQKCPQCAAISECLMDYEGDKDPDTLCPKKFPKAAKECFEWCYEYYEAEDEDEDAG
ncbi:MAG: hypothetical protein H6713_25795 [Myxococcales bacterium]|nr:hypothetical protein [Myxococcales bacterium]